MKRKKTDTNPLVVLYVVLLVVTVALVLRFGRAEEEDRLKVGFITSGSVESGGWDTVTYRGLEETCGKMGIDLLLRDRVSETGGACPQAVEELSRAGAKMIILNSAVYAEEMRELLDDYPDISFYASSSDYEAANLKSFSSRLYQARYLSGIVAGYQTKTGKLGFVAVGPQIEIYRGINAFALGVQRVAPDAEVVVYWTKSWDNEEAETAAVRKLVRDENVDVITYHQDRPHAVEAAEAADIYSIGYYEPMEGVSDKCLTCAVCDWAPLFEALLRDYLHTGGARTGWMGMESGVVGLTDYSPLVSQDARDEVEAAKQEILNGSNVFSGLIYDNTGKKRCGVGETISDQALQREHNWLVKGVRVYGD